MRRAHRAVPVVAVVAAGLSWGLDRGGVIDAFGASGDDGALLAAAGPTRSAGAGAGAEPPDEFADATGGSVGTGSTDTATDHAADHTGADHPAGDHPTIDHATDSHTTDSDSADNHPAGNHPADNHPAGNHATGGTPRAAHGSPGAGHGAGTSGHRPATSTDAHANHPATGPTPPARPTNQPGTGSPTPTPHPHHPPAPPTTRPAPSGRWMGSVESTPFGPVTVVAVLTNGRLTDVLFDTYPRSDPTSRAHSFLAMPTLRDRSIAAQSAQVAAVSQATYTSGAYRRSLQAALDLAGFR